MFLYFNEEYGVIIYHLFNIGEDHNGVEVWHLCIKAITDIITIGEC